MLRKKDDIDYEISVFKPNRLDFCWVMLFIVLNTIITFQSTSLMEYTIRIFIFLAAEQIKKYHKEWSYIVIGIGVFQWVHLAFLPARTNTVMNIVLYILTGILAVYAGISSLIKSINRTKFIKKEGM